MLPEAKEKLVDNMADNLPVLRKKAKLSQEELANIYSKQPIHDNVNRI